MGIPAAGIAAMGKRWQNQSVVTQGYCGGADAVSRGEQGRRVAGPYGEPQGSCTGFTAWSLTFPGLGMQVREQAIPQ